MNRISFSKFILEKPEKRGILETQMSANTFGHIFKFHSFGESHGPALGVVVEGCPAGVSFSMNILKRELDRRRPGRSAWTSSRKEKDQPEILSGVYEGKTLGTPIALLVFNEEMRSQDYKSIKKNPRPGHADDLWKEKFSHFDHRGGGRASGERNFRAGNGRSCFPYAS